MHDFCLRQALQSQDLSDSGVAACALDSAPAPELVVDEPAEPSTCRPSVGSAYALSSYRGARSVTMAERFGHNVAPAEQEEDASPLRAAREARRERIRMLEQGLRTHDEDRAREFGEGTVPLQWPGGPSFLAVAPPEPRGQGRLHIDKRLHLTSMHASHKEAMRDLLIGNAVLGAEVGNRPPSPRTLAALRATSVVAPTSPTGAPRSAPSSPGRQRGYVHSSKLSALDSETLLRDAEGLLQVGVGEDQWCRVAAQLSTKAYDMEPLDVLRAVRVLGTVVLGQRGGTVSKASARKEIARAADHLIQSLTARLQDEPLDVLLEVLETMSDARVGSQQYLDMLMALILARHHRDCQALRSDVALRLATALGRLAGPGGLRLRPKGVGGPQTTTSCKLMDVLQQRIVGGLDTCSVEALARLDEYYVSRLCDQPVAVAVVVRMAQLDMGFKAATRHHLSLAVRLEEAVRRELPQAFIWSLPRPARDYLERLKLARLRKDAPWTLGEASPLEIFRKGAMHPPYASTS